jgi:DivIVA domain-containing protein
VAIWKPARVRRVLMGILDACGWIIIALAAANAAGPLSKLVRAGRSGEERRLGAIPAWVWSGLLLSLMWLADGILWLRYPHRTWLYWIVVPIGLAWLISLAAPGIASRREAGVAWWRFGARIIPPPSAAGFTGPGDVQRLLHGPAGPAVPKPAIMLDATTVGLIERIKNARFSTTRLSLGYDEEEVDILLDKLIVVLGGGGQPDQEELRNAQFSATWLRPGYGRQDVDTFLHEIARATLL